MRSTSCIGAQGEMKAFTAPQTHFCSYPMAASSCIAPIVAETLLQHRSNVGIRGMPPRSIGRGRTAALGREQLKFAEDRHCSAYGAQVVCDMIGSDRPKMNCTRRSNKMKMLFFASR